MACRRGGDEDGNVIVSHLLVTILVVTIAAGLLQLAGALYVKGIVTDAAAAGARVGALVYAPDGASEKRVRELVAQAAPGCASTRCG